MIRVMESSEMQDVIRLIQADINLTAAEIEDVVKDQYAVVFHDGTLKGLAVLQRTPRSHQYDGMVYVYVHPDSRRQGIGRALWNHVWRERHRQGLNRIWTKFRVGEDLAVEAFFARRGFEKVVDVDLMRYEGSLFDPLTPGLMNLRVELYDDTYFHTYLKTMNDAFYSLREEVGIQPAFIYPQSAFEDAELRANVYANRENIFLFFAGTSLIGLTEVDGRYLDSIAVIDGYQGRGYGRIITQYTVNRMVERGVCPVYLGVGRPNRRARALYARLGFVPDQTTQLRRMAVEGRV